MKTKNISNTNENTMSKETFHFLHNYNARNDIKLQALLVEHGAEGYGLYWAIIEDLYHNANALPLDYICIAYHLRARSSMIQSIVNDFDLFEVVEDKFGISRTNKRTFNTLHKK